MDLELVVCVGELGDHDACVDDADSLGVLDLVEEVGDVLGGGEEVAGEGGESGGESQHVIKL